MDPEAAADRLEAALERIAQAATREIPLPAEPSPISAAEPSPIAEAEEIAARLDSLIDRLRTALGDKPG